MDKKLLLEKNYCYYSPIVGFLVVFFHLILAFIPVSLFYILSFKSIFAQTLFLIFAIVFIGTRLRALGNIIHECVHSSFVASRSWNKIIGTLLSILTFSHFKSYKRIHFTHHRYLGNQEKDLDFIKFNFLNTTAHKNKSLLFLLTYLPQFWFVSLREHCLFSRKDSTLETIARVLYYISLLTITYFFGMKFTFIFIILPFLTSYQWLKLFSDLIDHAPLLLAKNEERSEKTANHIFSLGILNALLFPRNDAYHLVHHLYPRLPTTQLKKAHNILLRDENYAEQKHIIF